MPRALFEILPQLATNIPVVDLGTWPTPLERIELGGHEVWLKREDLSAEGYAGNKIRPLEVVFGAARAAEKREIWATGAYGSNHALAAVIHARRAGFGSGVILWPQPWSRTAAANLEVTVSLADEVRFAASVITMPLIGIQTMWTRSAWVMPPGAATPLGAMGHASAAVEVARQLPGGPRTIVLPTGSTCTAVGMLVGTALARRVGLIDTLPKIMAVRVTPWPVTDRYRIARMALATQKLFERRGAPSINQTYDDYLRRLTVVGDELGDGYGVPTAGGWRAIADFWHRGIRLDTTYSAKAAAWLMRKLPELNGPVVFWLTKSAVALPAADANKVDALPHPVRSWLTTGRAIANPSGLG